VTIDERISAELRRHAPEVDEHTAWDRIRSQSPVHRRSRTIRLLAVPVAAAGFLLVGSILVSTSSSDPGLVGEPPSPLLGTWVSIDGDGSTLTATIEVSTDGSVEIVVVDDFASVCSGAPSTMTGTGSFEGDNELVFSSPVLTCDDGSQPEALSGPPLDEQLENLTFSHDPQADTMTDNNLGSVWTREGAEDPTPSSITTASPMVGWPQASLREVQEAQQLADAGDANYTWQLEPNMESILTATGQVETPEILARFVREQLGWEEFALTGETGDSIESQGIRAVGAQLIRCEPGRSNPLWPNDPLVGGCAPTIDDFHYETVQIFVAQPGKRGPEGIWVASHWEEFDPPVEQFAPLTEVEIAEILEPFLQARIAGEGAEQHLDLSDDFPQPGFLYSTSTGAPYEQAEFEVASRQEWPGYGIELTVRMFAEGGQTVVEQPFWMDWHGASWVLHPSRDNRGTENGLPLPRG
jgi:hypothetical protein